MDPPLLRTLIVDDEPIARRVLREDLELLPGVEVVGEAENGKEALLRIGKLKPDLVFLDLQMPVMSGFEVARNLTGRTCACGGDCHGVRSSMPSRRLRPERWITCSNRLANRGCAQRWSAPGACWAGPWRSPTRWRGSRRPAEASQPGQRRKVVGRSGADYFLVDADEMLAFQAERALVWIITAKQRLLATQPLRAIQERLGERAVSARAPQRHRQREPRAQDERPQQPAWLVTLSNSLQLTVSKRQAAISDKSCNGSLLGSPARSRANQFSRNGNYPPVELF